MRQLLSADQDLIELGLAHLYRVLEPSETNDSSLPVTGFIFHLDKEDAKIKGAKVHIQYDNDTVKLANNSFHFYHFMIPQYACGLIPQDVTSLLRCGCTNRMAISSVNQGP